MIIAGVLLVAALVTAGTATTWWLAYRRGWADGRHTGWHELAPLSKAGGCFLCEEGAPAPEVMNR